MCSTRIGIWGIRSPSNKNAMVFSIIWCTSEYVHFRLPHGYQQYYLGICYRTSCIFYHSYFYAIMQAQVWRTHLSIWFLLEPVKMRSQAFFLHEDLDLFSKIDQLQIESSVRGGGRGPGCVA